MCLAVPAKVVELCNEETCRVDVGGNILQANRVLIEELAVGEIVLLHAGFAIEKYDPDLANEVLNLLKGG